MLRFTIGWEPNVSFQIYVPRDDTKFCEEFLSVMSPKDFCNLFQYNGCTVSDKDGKEKLFEFLRQRLDEGFSFPNPDYITVRQVL